MSLNSKIKSTVHCWLFNIFTCTVSKFYHYCHPSKVCVVLLFELLTIFLLMSLIQLFYVNCPARFTLAIHEPITFCI